MNTANNLEENSGIFQPKSYFLNFVGLKLHKCFFYYFFFFYYCSKVFGRYKRLGQQGQGKGWKYSK